MKIYLVTGTAGFIGASTAKRILQEGNKVIGLDNLNSYYDIRIKNNRLKDLISHPNFSFYPIDIENRSSLESLFKIYNFDIVINLAARAGVRYSLEDPFIYASTNYHGTLNLLDLMRKFKVSKYVMASTSSIYAGSTMPYKESSSVNEPISPYAASKKAAELISYTYAKQFDIDVSILRYFTVYGPSGRPDMSVLRFIKWIDEGTPILLYGDGSQSRDFTYIDDIVDGTVKAAQKSMGYEIINLGGGKNPIKISKLIAIIEENLGKKAIINNQPFHAADVMETWADISKANELLNWQPTITLEEGIEKTVIWYKANLSWLKDVDLI